jgi:uncharacterized protein YqhQ
LLFLAAPVLGTKGVGWLDRQQHRQPDSFQPRGGCDPDRHLHAVPGRYTAVSKDIKRFFAYHGAEHKAIKVYERGEELVPENARKLDTSHVRCGTSFILYVLVLSILVFSLLPIDWWVEAVASRVIVIRSLRASASSSLCGALATRQPLVKALIWPGCSSRS